MKKSRLLGAVCACVIYLSVTSINAASTGIYWTDTGTGTIQHAGLDGSGVTTLVSGLSNPQGLVVYDDSLFWTDRDDQLIRQANSDGTNIQILLNTAPGVPRKLAVTDDYIYWANTLVDSVSRVNRDGMDATALVTDDLGFPNSVAVTDDYLYWSDSGTTSIKRSDLNGSNIITVVGGLPTTHLPTSIFITNAYLYWATRDLALTQGGDAVPGTIQRTNLDGTNIITLVDGLVFPQQVVVTADYVYWADQNTGKIQRSNLDGSGKTDIIVGQTTPVGLSVVSPDTVTIDIKPSKKPENIISLKKGKNLKVAIVGSAAFDALQVDPITVKFGPSEVSPVRFKGKDYNRDGYSDLILTFKLNDTGIDCGDTEATLTGQTFPDPVIDIAGSDTFTVEPCP